jgi:hypothetical protein
MDNIHNGLAKQVKELFLSNSNTAYCIEGATEKLDFKFKRKNVSLAIARLYQKGKLIRTKGQLAKGFYYSAANVKLIEKIYENHLLPYDFVNRQQLIDLITKKEFEPLNKTKILDLNHLKYNKFLMKYDFDYFLNKETQKFLASLVGFCMCDGHIRLNYQCTTFFFRFRLDADKFCMDFKKFFPYEKLYVVYKCYCYRVRINSKEFSKFLAKLGSPIGNKVLQPFLIPEWILYGPEDIKITFLNSVYGGEGSAPTDGAWRIQFVISKNIDNIENLLEFENQIRQMLFHIGITTTHIQLRNQKGRHFHGRFYIKGKENLRKFYNLLQYSYASEKQEVLANLIAKGNSFRTARVRLASEHPLTHG